MWEILLETVYKTCIIDMELSTTPLTNGCHDDDMIQLGSLHSQSLFRASRSVMSILYTFSCNTATCCNQLDSNLANLGATVNLK